MPYKHNQHIDPPAFKELAYRAFKNTTQEQRGTLFANEYKMFKDDATLKRFCAEERIDYLLYLLAKVGVDWTFRIHEDALDADALEFNSIDQYDYPQKRVDLTEAAIREGVCIVSSRDVMVHSHLTSQNCTNKIYGISDFTKKLTEKGLDLQKLSSWDTEVGKAHETHDMFNMLLLEQLNSFKYAEETLDLDEYDLRILCALFAKRSTAIRLTDIATLTKADGKKMYFRKNMQKMLDQGLVTSDTKDTKKIWANSSYFMITTAGLNKIITYQKFVHKNTFNI